MSNENNPIVPLEDEVRFKFSIFLTLFFFFFQKSILILEPDLKKEHRFSGLINWLKKNSLLTLTMLGVILGLALGGVLTSIGISQTTATVVGFPGELLLRMLKMLVLPLIVSRFFFSSNTLSKIEKVFSFTFFLKITSKV